MASSEETKHVGLEPEIIDEKAMSDIEQSHVDMDITGIEEKPLVRKIDLQ
jgi:hypothetical protein